MQIAKNGVGTTYPNPSVGAVIVYDGLIIGEGFTSPYGGSHAEVNAINSVKDKTCLPKATLYVTLEPCSHYGKTPPCADLIVKNNIKQVIIGCVDTNTLVAGKGIKRLTDAGVKVTVGVLEKECQEHHKRFFTAQNKNRPYIILKWAQTQNGFIAPEAKSEQKPVFISNEYSQQLVHKWRSQEHAILVGTNTVVVDNPKLTVRSWSGKNPIRVVLDKNLRIFKQANVLDNSVKTIFLIDKNTSKPAQQANIVFEQIDFLHCVAKQTCEVLQKHQIQSLIVEGGLQTLQTFIDANIWDEARVFKGKTTFKNGTKSPEITGTVLLEKEIKNDILTVYKNSCSTS